uniref:Uncharacterized protein n=1 Tax=Anguilla anguilla TaxID=7936 RepID=A0A0E9Q5H7_ANGAN
MAAAAACAATAV